MMNSTSNSRDLERNPWSWAIPLVLAVVASLAFWPAIPNGFVSWDDEHNFTWNLDFGPLTLTRLAWAWTNFRAGVYQPLGWIVLEIQASLWGMDPRGYHAMNLFMHAINIALLYRLIIVLLDRCQPLENRDDRRARSLAAGLATLFFAVHPLRVEVVAWASCQTYLPSITCAMAAILAYLRAHPRTGATSRAWLILAWIWFVSGMLFKAEAATLPGLLVILDVYPLRRLGRSRWLNWRVWLEKIPFVIPALVILWVAVWARGVFNLQAPVRSYGFLEHLGQACYSVCFYLARTVWPSDLSIYYGLPDRINPMDGKFGGSIAVVVVVSLGAYLARRRWPGLAAVWLAYLVCLSLHLGFVQAGTVITADRYSYLATIPLTIWLAAILARLFSIVGRFRSLVILAGLGLILVLAGLTWAQCRQWGSSEILLRMALAHEGSQSAEVRSALGLVLKRSGKLTEAAELYEEALRIAPDYLQARYYLGAIRGEQGQYDQAEMHLAAAERIDPDDRDVQYNLAVVLARQGKVPEAIGHLQRAIKIRPQADDAFNLAILLSERNQYPEAADAYRLAIQLRPDHAPTHNNLGAILYGLGRYPEAEAEFQQALRIQPDYPRARKGLDLVQKKMGQGPGPLRKP